MKNNIQIYLTILCFLLSMKCNSQQKIKTQNIDNTVNSRNLIENFLEEKLNSPCGDYKKVMLDIKDFNVGEKTKISNIGEFQFKNFQLRLMFQVVIGENDCKQHSLFLNSESIKQGKIDSIKIDWLIGGVGELNAWSKISIIKDTLSILTAENEKLIDLDNGTIAKHKKNIFFFMDENGGFKIKYNSKDEEIIYCAEKYYFIKELLTDYLSNHSTIQKKIIPIKNQSFLIHLLEKKTKELDLLVLRADKHGIFNYKGSAGGLGIELNNYKISEIGSYENGLKFKIEKKTEPKQLVFYYQNIGEKFSLEKLEISQYAKVETKSFDKNKYIPLQKIGQYCKEEFSKK